MVSGLLCRAETLTEQVMRAQGPSEVSVVCSMASGGGVSTDNEKATGLERESMLAADKGLEPYIIQPTTCRIVAEMSYPAPRVRAVAERSCTTFRRWWLLGHRRAERS
uniref:Uncharacterized protein n=1 Tax=Moschus moschiferus TaxID=68415 RepID=A0A8C6CI38_MOSMO